MSAKNDKLCDGLLLSAAIGACAVGTWMGVGAKGLAGSALCVVGCLLSCFVGILLLRRPEPLLTGRHMLCAIFGLYLAMCLRLCLLDYTAGDYNGFLHVWVDSMKQLSVREVLVTPIGDYNMPYLYLLLVLSRLPIYDLYGIKLISLLADVCLAEAVARLVGLSTRRGGVILASFLATLLAPTVVINSGLWGQCDAVYSAFALWGLYLGLKDRPVLSVMAFACAFSFKLQAVFILPILLFLLVKGKLRLRHLWIFPATFLVIMLPVLLAGRSIPHTFGIYLNQARDYRYLSLNAPSVWAMIPNDYFDALDPAPVLMAGIGALLLLYGFLPRYRALEASDLIAVAFLFSLAIPWLLPRMHERYFYMAEVLSIPYAARRLRNLPAAVILLAGGFLVYCPYLFGEMPILSNAGVAAIYGLLLMYLTADLLRQTIRRERSDAVQIEAEPS